MGVRSVIEHRRGSILTSTADVIVIPVNTVGVMGAGLAKAAAQKWPHVERAYKDWCRRAKPRGGMLSIPFPDDRPSACLLATKEHWRTPSRLEWVRSGLDWLLMLTHGQSLALPMLGCGLGGLSERDVLPLVEARFTDSSRHVEVWRP